MKRLCIILLVLACVGGIFAQTAFHNVTVTLGAFQLIRLSDGGNITITIDNNDVATEGAQPSAETDNTQYLQYTICATAGADQEITAGLDSDMPAGLTLAAVAVVGSAGAGDEGTADTGGNLAFVAIDLISSIASCYTGTGATDGAQITYTATTDGTLAAQGVLRTVTYTVKADD